MKSEDELKRKLSEKFQEYEADPQEESWEKILFSLQLAQKLKDYEAEPEQETWSNIRLPLDLKATFQDYEVEPLAESWTKIQAAIQPNKRRRGILTPLFYRVGIAAGIALVLGSFWWLLSKDSPKNSGGITTEKKKQETVAQPVTKEKLQQGNKQENDALVIKKDSKIAPRKQNVIINSNDIWVVKRKSQKESLPAQLKTEIAENKQLNTPNNVLPTESATSNQNTTGSTDNQAALSLLDSKTFHPKSIKKPFGVITYNVERPMMEPEGKVVRRKLILTTSLMPLQTYQVFTVLPQTTTYIQQVGTLDALDNQRLGVQFRIGAMQPLSRRFSTGVSVTYTGIQQWANYEVNNGDYEIQTTDNGVYTLVGVGEQVTQNQFLQTVGLKLDNTFLVAEKKSKVYLSAGGEAVRLLNSSQYGYYVNASIGLAYPIKGGKSIWIEPTFRYGLSQSFDANNFLKIRPYNIGLNVRVNFI